MHVYVFFFKQKTAYEIGLGIPAEPLFRSISSLFSPFNQILKQNAKREMRLRLGKVTVADVLAAQPVTTNLLRSEERRVGKECRSRGTADHEKKKRRDAHNGSRTRDIRSRS